MTEKIQRPPAEVLYREELQLLKDHEGDCPRPDGWYLSPRSVADFILGRTSLGIAPKFVGKRSFIERCIVSLATNRGLMLIGDPGTAKSYLSELLCAAISFDSSLTIQGSAGTSEDTIKYSWNYALLLSKGPGEEALVPAPLYRGLTEGKIVRFEEITRCPLEIQDTLLSVLSDRVLSVPEMAEQEKRSIFANAGFNVIATANTRDRGVNEMSAALKRRFNFETVHPIDDINQEIDLVKRESEKMLLGAGIDMQIPTDLTEVLVRTFSELRNAKTAEGRALESLSTVMSTAEAVSVSFSAGIHAWYYSEGKVDARHLVEHMLGSALKDNPEDLKKLQHYFDNVAGKRKSPAWQAYYKARKYLS